ncbi:hypothetical protein EXN74_08915 [Leclercia adecarboxylata]|nr:hypothetical protein DVA43_17425 [Leclercia sp. W6]QBF86610.1 hypothetical protein EXN74_08915 [Leclercia adecarboxylata]
MGVSMTIERVIAAITYGIALFLAWLGDFSVRDMASVFSMILGAGTFAVYWYYSRKKYLLLKNGEVSQEAYERANR